jgi:hypothetical protein
MRAARWAARTEVSRSGPAASVGVERGAHLPGRVGL